MDYNACWQIKKCERGDECICYVRKSEYVEERSGMGGTFEKILWQPQHMILRTTARKLVCLRLVTKSVHWPLTANVTAASSAAIVAALHNRSNNLASHSLFTYFGCRRAKPCGILAFELSHPSRLGHKVPSLAMKGIKASSCSYVGKVTLKLADSCTI